MDRSVNHSSSTRTRLALLAVLMLGWLPAEDLWTATIERGVATEKRSNKAHAWIPPEVKLVRGVFLTQRCMFEARITKDSEIRKACAEKQIAIVYAECGIGLRFQTEPESVANLEGILRDLGKATQHPELEFAPLITAGHSTAGIFCRNVAYWKPERVAGVIHIMSGNLQAHIEDPTRSLAGVPFLFINGEWEQFGPDGGDIKGGLRSDMGLRKGKGESQTQWICMRQQILARRGRNPDNLMGLVVSRNHNHTRWEGAMSGMVSQFIASVADLRIPKGDPDGRTMVRCLPVKAEQGWLLDADIKAPKADPAPFADFKGDKRHALWYPDQAMAMKVWDYNQKGWPDPDPTAAWPVEKRYAPEANLADLVDAPPAPVLTWAGGDGPWDAEKTPWRDASGQMVAWNPQSQAVFTGAGGTVRIAANVSCSGLTLGKGYTLVLGTSNLGSRAGITLEAGSTLDVTLKPTEANGRWGARMSSAGNLKFAGRLILRGENLKAGQYHIVRASSRSEGAFDQVVAPEGWEVKGNGGSVNLVAIPAPTVKPPPAAAQPALDP